MGKLTPAAMAVAAKLTQIESPTISKKSPKWQPVQKRSYQGMPHNSIGATKPRGPTYICWFSD
jgi:hypothetical protein